jgi:CHAT domain-containing protein/Tfp pilus assembly protein PilF
MGWRRVFLASCLVVAAVSATGGQTSPARSPEALALAAKVADTADDAARAALLAADGAPPDLGAALVEEGNRHFARSRFTEAMRAYAAARRVAEQAGDRRVVARSALGLGTVYGRQGDYPSAARFLREGLALSEEFNDIPNVENGVNNLGIVSRLQGEYDEALAYYQRALVLSERMTDRTSTPRVLNNIGVVHMLRGSHREALDYFQRSLRLKEANGQTADIPTTLSNIGQVYERMGDLDRALEFHTRSVAVFEQVGNGASARVAIERSGRVHAAQGRLDEAVRHYERALALGEAAGARADIASALAGLGSVHRTRGDTTAALGYYRRSLAIREAINDRPGLADTLVDVAILHQRRGDPGAALEAAERATRTAGETGTRETYWRARLAAATAAAALGRPAAAREAYADAIDTLETLRGDAAGGLLERQRYFELRLAPYQRLAALLVDEGEIADAFAVAERARSRVMLDILQAGRAETRLLGPEQRERERQLEREMTAALTRVWAERGRPAPDAAHLARLEDELRRARTAHADFRAALYDAQPVLRLSRGDAQPGSLVEAAAMVDARTALLSYFVTPEATYLFAVSSSGPRAYRIAVTQEELRARTSRFREQLAARDLEAAAAGRALYQLLVAPAASHLRGTTNLVIVPDGSLWELPFQALQSGSRRYLLEDAAVSYAPSVAVLREMRRRRANAGGPPPAPLLALGDPEVAGDFEPLPGTARQVEVIGRMYGAASRVFTGAGATEERLRAAAADASVLHLATHGVLDDANPMYSYVALAGDPSADAARDGRLEAWEVMTLNLRADIVVLAACETARGHVGAGEGVVGLSWAFFLAGVPRTVVSLWKVDAASTTDLMLAFHRLARPAASGRPRVAEALRAAALTLLRDPRYSHPFYWAAFGVIGDGS